MEAKNSPVQMFAVNFVFSIFGALLVAQRPQSGFHCNLLFRAISLVLESGQGSGRNPSHQPGIQMRNLLIVVLNLAVLYCAWYAARWAMRTYRSSPRVLSDQDRRDLYSMQTDSVRRELGKRLDEVRQYQDRQRVRYRMRWQALRLASGGDEPPRDFDPAVAEHLTFALSVVGDYDAAREDAGAFADCLYRPASDLPYPRDAIRTCCEFLIRIAEGASHSPHRDLAFIANERDALGIALFSLDYFLDTPASEIPREKQENLAFVKRRYVPGTKATAKPRAGDRVVTRIPGETDRIDQVIGLDHEDRWMVYASSGAPLQIVHNAELNVWEEVAEIAPAVAPLLKFTDEQPAVDVSRPPARAQSTYRGPSAAGNG